MKVTITLKNDCLVGGRKRLAGEIVEVDAALAKSFGAEAKKQPVARKDAETAKKDPETPAAKVEAAPDSEAEIQNTTNSEEK